MEDYTSLLNLHILDLVNKCIDYVLGSDTTVFLIFSLTFKHLLFEITCYILVFLKCLLIKHVKLQIVASKY